MNSLVLVFSLFLAVSANSIEEASREEMETERIIWGQNAASGQFPWVAALYFDGNFICTSSIISPTTVMTAAHCIKINNVVRSADRFYAIANVSKSARSVRINFASVTLHPDYERVIDNDIAIFKTTEPIPINDEVRPVCIARPNTHMDEYKTAIAMGWGNMIPISLLKPVTPDNLQYTEQKIVDNRLCRLTNVGINEAKVCSKGTKIFNGICNGDSGGPLVHVSADKRPVEIGIASYINGIVRCGKGVPAVWTRVAYHYDFIMQAAQDGSICVV